MPTLEDFCVDFLDENEVRIRNYYWMEIPLIKGCNIGKVLNNMHEDGKVTNPSYSNNKVFNHPMKRINLLVLEESAIKVITSIVVVRTKR